MHALIGPNGSGKSTLLDVLNGLLPPHRRAGEGLGRTFQNIRLFGAMSDLDNVIVGAEHPCNSFPAHERGRRRSEVERKALAALDFVGLAAPRRGAGREDHEVASLEHIAAVGDRQGHVGRSAPPATPWCPGSGYRR